MELNDSQLTYKCQPQKKGAGGLRTTEGSPDGETLVPSTRQGGMG